MPKLASHQSSEITKVLFLGDSGSGKTGALASLAGAGYNLRILDLDSGLDVLKNILSDPKSQYGKDALDRVDYITITDRMKNQSGRLVPKEAKVWTKTMDALTNWPGFGPIASWTSQDVLVIDSLTMLSTAALNFTLSLNARLGQQPHQSDWYGGQQLIESLLQMLYDEGIRCNVIVIAHITFIGEENGPVRGYPNTLGKSLPPKVGRYFNTILMAKSSGSGTALKRKIHTNPVGVIELKNTAPTRVLPEYPLETGLASYFAAVREPGNSSIKQTPAAVVSPPLPPGTPEAPPAQQGTLTNDSTQTKDLKDG